MSWNDPCRNCGEPRYACECIIEPPSKEYLEEYRKKQIENKKICDEIGHDWHYTFIVYGCKRCGETSEY